MALLLCVSLLSVRASNTPYANGDFNANGIVNIDDVTTLIDVLLRNNNVWMYYDVDRNVTVNIGDLTCLIDYLLTGEWELAYTGPEIPDSAEVFTVNGVTFAMMPVEGCHEVDILNNGTVLSMGDYYMGMTEVTRELWAAVMGEPRATCWPIYGLGPLHPVEDVSWLECQEFIARLNELTGREFHLPTVAQWYWAALGGKYSHGYTYAGSNNADEVCWHVENHPPYLGSGDYVFPVGMKAPNELGLYDMCGNAYEHMNNLYIRDGDSLEIPKPDDPYGTSYLFGGSAGTSRYDCIIVGCTPRGAWHMTQGRYFGFRLALQKEQ